MGPIREPRGAPFPSIRFRLIDDTSDEKQMRFYNYTEKLLNVCLFVDQRSFRKTAKILRERAKILSV